MRWFLQRSVTGSESVSFRLRVYFFLITPVKFDNVLYRHLSSLSASRERRLGNPTAQGVVSRAALSSPKSPLNTFIYLFIYLIILLLQYCNVLFTT